ncbi:type II and III secretion system protein family protein [Paracoccus sediminicola]|uniref:type II and III secretion system protein family protein n=1 Tax=Paracoccus sediminicola TaxID=3017783 RepID=UPI0022F0167E|nr:pilus assembly protein N-terminal domain-containing protein [Paracoccus sediminicola]WBU57197.1 pilus assembly protein N-terminal domain-containing protein [Paracoccus sediminicola]
MNQLIRLPLSLALGAILVMMMLTTDAVAQTRMVITEGEGRAIDLPAGTETVFVADPSIADAQAMAPGSIYVTGMSSGRTNLVLSDINNNQIGTYTIEVQAAGGGAGALLDDGLSAQQRENVVIISGNAGNVNAARSVAAAQGAFESQGLQVQDQTSYSGGTQVSLRVRFVEASRNDLQRLGVNLAALGSSSGGPLRVTTGLADPSGFIGGGSAGGPAIGGAATSGSFTIDTLIDALETRGAVQILSEPTLTTTSGTRASFRAGGEIAYPINQGDGVISAGFKEYGVSIDFTPTILPNNRIAIEVQPEVSFLDASSSVSVEGFQVPGVSVRRADTTVEVASGQTFAIAGLYEQFSENESQGVPGFGNVLGNNSRTRRERELIIFITPYLSEARDVAQPRAQRRAPQASVGFMTR